MVEKQLLKFLSERENFEQYSEYTNFLTPEARNLFKILGEYYDQFKGTDKVSYSDVAAWEILRHPGTKEDTRVALERICTDIDSICLSDIPDNIVNILLVRDAADRIMYAADKIISGDEEDVDEIEEIIGDYRGSSRCNDAADSMLVTTDAYDLFDLSVLSDGYTWRLNCLNEALGPLQTGNLIVFSARPDSGKTSMLASEATCIAQQFKEDEKVMWFCNEEPGDVIKRRVLTAGLNKSIKEISSDRSKYRTQLDEVQQRFIIGHKSGMGIKDIEGALWKSNPGLIIIDQLRKVHSPWNHEQEHLRLQKLFEWARELAGTAPVLVVHQAGGSGEGLMYMSMSDLHGSKTDIQGEADALIMIGKDNDPSNKNIRGISIPKNKMTGSNAAKRNLQEMVNINLDTGVFY